jgi:hypothetical protein
MVLNVLGAVLLSVVSIAGSAYTAVKRYEIWQRKRSPVIDSVASWNLVVNAQEESLAQIARSLAESGDKTLKPLDKAKVQVPLLRLREGNEALTSYRDAAQ